MERKELEVGGSGNVIIELFRNPATLRKLDNPQGQHKTLSTRRLALSINAQIEKRTRTFRVWLDSSYWRKQLLSDHSSNYKKVDASHIIHHESQTKWLHKAMHGKPVNPMNRHSTSLPVPRFQIQKPLSTVMIVRRIVREKEFVRSWLSDWQMDLKPLTRSKQRNRGDQQGRRPRERRPWIQSLPWGLGW